MATSLAEAVARHRAHNDLLSARYPTLQADCDRRETKKHLDEARRSLSRRDLPGAVASLLATVERVAGR